MFCAPQFSAPRLSAPILSRALAAVTASAIMFSAAVQASPVKTFETTDGRTMRSVEVKFVDLDLTTPAGAATLETRLKRASRQVCGTSVRAPLREQLDHNACLDQTLASGARAMVTLVARAEAGDNFKPGERIAVGS